MTARDREGTQRIAACQHTLSTREAQTRIADLTCKTSDDLFVEVLVQLRSGNEQWGARLELRPIGASVPLEIKVTSLMILEYLGYHDRRPPLTVSLSANKELRQTAPVPSDTVFGYWGVFFPEDSPPLATLAWDSDTGQYTTFDLSVYAGDQQIASCSHTLTPYEAQTRIAEARCETFDGIKVQIGFHLRAN